MSVYPYRELVGSLLYLSVCTRPDIADAVGKLACYMAKPTSAHWGAAKGVAKTTSSMKPYMSWQYEPEAAGGQGGDVKTAGHTLAGR